jgi:hypothetical protein
MLLSACAPALGHGPIYLPATSVAVMDMGCDKRDVLKTLRNDGEPTILVINNKSGEERWISTIDENGKSESFAWVPPDTSYTLEAPPGQIYMIYFSEPDATKDDECKYIISNGYGASYFNVNR